LKSVQREKRILSSFNLAVLISGSGSNLQAVIDAIENGTIPNAKVALVVSSRENVYGLERAQKYGITNIVIDRHDTKKLMETLKKHRIDGIILAGYLTVLAPDVITAYSGRIINIHPALLPLFGGKGFYGIKVHQAVLAAGEKHTGATAHLVDCGVDTGAVLVRGVLPILPDDTAESLQKRVLVIEHKVLVQAVKALVDGKTEDLIKNPLTIKF
jgi:phosphoribosylglycinamide formyltransferase-1